jgi:hypothetical protein
MRTVFRKIVCSQAFQITFAVFIAFGIISSVLLIENNRAHAQSAMIPFGGQIENVQYCCDGSVLLTVGPPDPGFYDYRPGVSTLYEYYQVFSEGPWVLGTAIPGGYCDLPDAECAGGIEANTVMSIGTSQL